jgi:hypothetical protein
MKITPFVAVAVFVGFIGSAQAAPVSQIDHLSGVSNQFRQVEETQFVYRHRRYCFYPNGWHGPGFYWCGYAWRRGFGWGGPRGWHGWRVRPHHRHMQRQRRELRRERRELRHDRRELRHDRRQERHEHRGHGHGHH